MTALTPLTLITMPIHTPYVRFPIDDLVDEIKPHYLMNDPYPLYAVLGAWAANHMDGDPVWLMLVAPPSSGGTLQLDWLRLMPNLHYVDSLSKGALISGTSTKEKGKEATGGILMEMRPWGVLVLSDFTSILSLPPNDLKDIIGTLRKVYDGQFTRPVGTDGGHKVIWEGKVGVLGKSTPTIDHHHDVLGEMGERFIYYRMESPDRGYAMAEKALRNVHKSDSMAFVQDQVCCYLSGLDIPNHLRQLSDPDISRLIAMATLCGHMRGSVRRDYKGQSKEITGLPVAEMPSRVAQVLARLHDGMLSVGVGEQDAWNVVSRAALDSVPKVRKLIVEYVVRATAPRSKSLVGGRGLTTSGVNGRGRALGSVKSGLGLEWVTIKELQRMAYEDRVSWGSERVLRYGIEELTVHGVLEQRPSGVIRGPGSGAGRPSESWRLSDWAKREWGHTGW